MEELIRRLEGATEGSRDAEIDSINAHLMATLPREQIDRVFSYYRCDIDPEFLGFVEIYSHLADVIPLHFSVIDLGCAYAPQAFLFQRHHQYIGVDISDCPRFHAANTQHYTMKIADFIAEHGPSIEKETTFAICSYVPPWGGDNRKMVRDFFPNVFTYYPASLRAHQPTKDSQTC